MNYKCVKEPLSDPANTLESLISEIFRQAFEFTEPMKASSSLQGIVEEFRAKTTTIIEGKQALDLLKAEILRRFAELEKRVKIAEQATQDKP